MNGQSSENAKSLASVAPMVATGLGVRTMSVLLQRVEAYERQVHYLAESLDAIREALGQKSTHYMVMAIDVREVVQALDAYASGLAEGPDLAKETLQRVRHP